MLYAFYKFLYIHKFYLNAFYLNNYSYKQFILDEMKK